MNRWWLAAVTSVGMFLALGPPDAAAEKKQADKKAALTEPAVFAMKEVPAFGKEEAEGSTRYRYPSGAFSVCSPAPSNEVKAYPKLKSKRPLYGSLTLDGSPVGAKPGKTLYFVLDQSGEAASVAAEEKTEKAAGKKTASEGTLKYDRLYFDCNGDLDLTNDGFVKLADKPPYEDLPPGTASDGFFDDVKVMIDFGPELGTRPVVLVPHGSTFAADGVLMQFLPKTARQGKIRLGGKQYVARLSQSRMLSGRYDRPFVQLELSSVEGSKTAPFRPGPLGQMRWIDGQFVTLSASPLGDKLTVEPYRGETGILEIGAGGRAITDLGITGQLVSRTGVMVALAEGPLTGEAMARRCPLPVGDYTLPAFTAKHGRLRFSGRMAANSGGSSAVTPLPSYPIQIRKDKPFVMEFSGKPEVKFMTPPKDQAFKPGDNVRIAAMLTEPWQGIQITGLWDTTSKEGGPAMARLDPTIAIRNAAGEVVTEGKMPFG